VLLEKNPESPKIDVEKISIAPVKSFVPKLLGCLLFKLVDNQKRLYSGTAAEEPKRRTYSHRIGLIGMAVVGCRELELETTMPGIKNAQEEKLLDRRTSQPLAQGNSREAR